jgi:hypothetical protein
MVSTIQQHEDSVCASYVTCSMLILAVAALLSAVMHSAVDLLQKH